MESRINEATDNKSENTTRKTVRHTRDEKLTNLTHEGYNHTFLILDNNDFDFNVECVFCFMVIRDTVQISACGHSFCLTCWHDWIQASGDPVLCPVDKKIVDVHDVFRDRNRDRFILGLKVHCDNKDFGCDVISELKDIQTHLEKCKYQLTSCELMCGEKMLLWSLADHMNQVCPRRILSCNLCDIQLMAQDFMFHKENCPMKKVGCDVCNSAPTILMKDLDNHKRTTCPKSLTYCSFALIGCNIKVVREDLNSHHKLHTQEHLSFLNSAVSHLYEDVGSLSLLNRDSTPQTSDNHRELPRVLWSKVKKDKSDATIEWNELPGCVYEVFMTTWKHKPLSETVNNLVRKNINASKENASWMNESARFENNFEMRNVFATSKLENNRILVEGGSSARDHMELKKISGSSEGNSDSNHSQTRFFWFAVMFSFLAIIYPVGLWRLNGEVARLSEENVKLYERNTDYKEIIEALSKDSAKLWEHIVEMEDKYRQLLVDVGTLSTGLADMKKSTDLWTLNEPLYTELIEGGDIKCPCMWTVEVSDGMLNKNSPEFHTHRDIQMRFIVGWTARSTIRIDIVLVQHKFVDWLYLQGISEQFAATFAVVDAETNKPIYLEKPLTLGKKQPDNGILLVMFYFYTEITIQTSTRSIIILLK